MYFVFCTVFVSAIMSQYVVLLSSSSHDIFADNRTGSFKVELPEEINFLESDWHVGLVEMFYPKTWKNITEGRNELLINEHAIKIPPGYYAEPKELCKTIQTQMAQRDIFKDTIEFIYDKPSGTITLSMLPGYMVKIPERSLLASCLGMEIEKTYSTLNLEKRKFFPMQQQCNMNTIDRLFVYSDVCQYIQVGRMKTPLLRIVSVSGAHKEPGYNTFFPVHYLPIMKRNFHTIEMSVTDEVGQILKFHYGTIIAVLHFKRISNNLGSINTV